MNIKTFLMIFNVIVALLLHGGTQITLMLWTPDPDRVYLFYIFAAMWGMGDAVIQTQINGKDPTIYPLHPNVFSVYFKSFKIHSNEST